MKEIALTKGKFALVDDEDFERIARWKWHAMESRGLWYGVRKYWDKDRRRYFSVLMHREIISAPHGALVDHINGNGLDNSKANLRLADHSRNGMNSKRSCINTSGHKGINWDKFTNMWLVRIAFEKKSLNLGRYKSLDEAVAIRREAERTYYGEFAR